MDGGYTKLIDKARKLKALADRGNGGEMESAKRFYDEFINKNNISEQEIDLEYFKRTFTLADNEYEILLSHIIMSVNPFCVIKRDEHHKLIVPLDDEDYVEVENKFRVFHNVFKKDEKRMLRRFVGRKDYDNEKFIFFSGFISFHQNHFVPDAYSVSKQRGSDGRSVNPDMADKVSDTVNSNEKIEKKEFIQEKAKQAKEAKKKLDDAPPPKTFNEKEIEKLIGYSEDYTVIKYVRAKKTLMEKSYC